MQRGSDILSAVGCLDDHNFPAEALPTAASMTMSADLTAEEEKSRSTEEKEERHKGGQEKTEELT